MKKKIYKISIILLLILIVLLSTLIIYNGRKQNDKYLLLGNPLQQQIDVNYNDTFASSFIDASFLEKMLLLDSSKQVDDSIVKLSSLIKTHNKIIVNVGKNELISWFNNNYDLDIIKRKENILINNVESIIKKIIEINNSCVIYLLKLTSFENVDLEVINSVNNMYEQISQKYNLGKLTYR